MQASKPWSRKEGERERKRKEGRKGEGEEGVRDGGCGGTETQTDFSSGCYEVTLGSAYATCLVHNTSLNKR